MTTAAPVQEGQKSGHGKSKKSTLSAIVVLLLACCTCYTSRNQVRELRYDVRATNVANAAIELYTAKNGLDYLRGEESDRLIHVLMCLSGNHSGFFLEFEMALKSVLLNAPEWTPLTIHAMTDDQAYDALHELLERIHIQNWTSRFPVTIRIYNCSAYIPQWRNTVKKLYGKNTELMKQAMNKHTIGTWFRLFSHVVLPDDVKHILYIDTDVIIMANLQGLWNHIDSQADVVGVYWGESQCAGFMILNVPQLPTMWNVVEHAFETKMSTLTKELKMGNGDQSFLTAFQYERPDFVVTLPSVWDNNLADGLWKFKTNLQENRPEIGYIHFNGGGKKKDSWFLDSNDESKYSWWITDQSPEFPVLHSTFGLVDYYIRMSWEWASYFSSSKIPSGRMAYNLTLEFI